jgi:hypothetical protein
MRRSNGDGPKSISTGPRLTTWLASSPGLAPGPIKEAVENDPATEVQTAAMGAQFTGWHEHSRIKDVLGR